LPDLPASKTPLADASRLFMGASGALVISLGSLVSMTGNNLGAVLTGSRMLFALAENGELPRWFADIHPRYRTPANAVMFTTLVALGLALSGSFVILAVASAVARLVAYTGACAATLRLRHSSFRRGVSPATFVIPGGRVVPSAAIAVSLLILAGATRAQLLGGAAGLALGALLFVANQSIAQPKKEMENGT
jgi:basic amino acid/polyamine antiporter, APA family